MTSLWAQTYRAHSGSDLQIILKVPYYAHLKITAREWNLLKELVGILKPFGEAPDLTQGEKVVTISAVPASSPFPERHGQKSPGIP